ncbi:MAG: hypothetical protein JW969_16555 [Spirochaetales bacterium]|nr:hypothetical protein [Spirochaetales bacterium]
MRIFIFYVLIILLILSGCASDPYYNALSKGDLDKVRGIIEANPEMATEYFENGAYPLHVAVAYHKPDVVRYLLSVGADPNEQYEGNGLTPLMKVWPNDLEWMQSLFRKYFPVDAKVSQRDYLLAIIEISSMVDKKLLEARAAGSEGDNTALILLNAGADINAVDSEGRNALWHVIGRYGPVTLQLLLEEGTKDLQKPLNDIKIDIDKLVNETITYSDLGIHEKFWLDYGYHDQKYVIRIMAFSRQLSYYLIQREILRRGGVENVGIR